MRPVVHLLGLAPLVGEVLVRVHGHGPPALSEHIHNLAEELITRVEMLAHVVVRVVAMLAYEADAVHRKLVSAQRQRLRNARAVPQAGTSQLHRGSGHCLSPARCTARPAGFAAPSAHRWENSLPASARRSRPGAHYECIGSTPPQSSSSALWAAAFAAPANPNTLAARKSRRLIPMPPCGQSF